MLRAKAWGGGCPRELSYRVLGSGSRMGVPVLATEGGEEAWKEGSHRKWTVQGSCNVRATEATVDLLFEVAEGELSAQPAEVKPATRACPGGCAFGPEPHTPTLPHLALCVQLGLAFSTAHFLILY